MKLKMTAIISLVAAVAFVLTACGGKDDGAVTTTTNVSTAASETSGTTTSEEASSGETMSDDGMISDLSEGLSSGMSEAGSNARRIF